jgi:uncharacterized protein (DUF1697 family)
MLTTYIALLRAVNLPGHHKLAMRDLCACLERIGMDEPRSLLQSGNVVFRCKRTATAELEARLEAAAAKHLHLETDFHVRTVDEWKAIVAGNPFPDAARNDPSHLLVLCLKGATDRTAEAALQRAIVGREVVRTNGREAYLVFPDGIGTSRLTTAVIERHLGTRGTGRNWNTVLKLAAMTAPA